MLENAFLAPLLAILAAMLFAVSTNVIKKGMAYVDPQTASVISIAATMFCYVLVSPVWMRWEYWASPAILVFALIGVIQPVFSRYLSYEATRRVGPTTSATFDATTPLIVAIMAIIALGEIPNWGIASGTLIIVFGVMVVSWNYQGGKAILQAALLFALGTSLIRALSTVAGKYGMNILPSPLMAAFVTFGVSLVGSILLYGIQKGEWPRRFPRKGIIWCSISGLFSAIAVICMYSALSLGQVLVVSPILYTYPIFTLGFAWLLRIESLTFRKAAGAFLVAGGVMLVTLYQSG